MTAAPGLEQKIHKTAVHGITYSFWHHAAENDLPTILFLHGFPDSSYCWRKVLPHFVKKGYGVVAPDLLGYGKTDKPTEPEAFRYKRQVESLISLLDAHGVDKFVVVGHDWGVVPTSRLLNYFPERILAATFIASTYFPPGDWVDVEKANKWSLENAGYERRGYFYFMTSAYGAQLIKDNVDSFISLAWNEKPEIWAEDWCPTGAMEKWLRANKKTPSAEWFSKEDHEYYRKSLTEGIHSQVNWYRVSQYNLSYDEEKKLPEGREFLHMPVLFIPCSRDKAAIPALQRINAEKYCKGDWDLKEIESSHWGPCERSSEVCEYVEDWIEQKVLKK